MNRDITNGQPRSGIRTAPGLARLLCVAGLAFAGCTEPNPRYCDATEDCPEGKHCDLSVHRCVPTECGDGVVEGRESCDGQALNNRTCADESTYLHGELFCTAQCEFDISQCHTCGNGTIEGSENCDGTDLGGSDCAAQGLQHGQLACSDQCAFDLSNCHTCGDGVVEGPESCDGPALSNQTCQTLGHTGGSLSCGADCSFDESGCFDCGDGACHQASGETVQNCPADCGWSDISAGGYHACAAKGDGMVWCWGSNAYNQLGDGQTHQTCGGFDCSRSPVSVPNVGGAVSVSAGSGACVLRGDGTVLCWGANSNGRVGDGTTIDRPTPVQVIGLGGLVSLSARHDHHCAIRSDGTLWCWGGNNHGQLGDNAVHQDCGGNDCSPVPVQVPNLPGVVSVSTGDGFTCAALDDGTVWCWGRDDQGQLGDAATHSACSGGAECSPVPVQVTNLQNAVLVAAGGSSACATKTDGTVWCWGSNRWGQLGDGATHQTCNVFDCSPVPVPVFGMGGAISIAAGGGHACAVKADGTAWCWGRNVNGECGTGDAGDKSVPEQVWVLTDAVDITAGSSFTCAVEADGDAFCWGLNVDGQLGDGNTANYSLTPVQVIDPYQ